MSNEMVLAKISTGMLISYKKKLDSFKGILCIHQIIFVCQFGYFGENSPYTHVVEGHVRYDKE